MAYQSNNVIRPVAGILDVCFVVDTTRSMEEYLEMTKLAVQKLINQIKERTNVNEVSVRFGFVAYRDHPP